jgi:hypothetical protein
MPAQSRQIALPPRRPGKSRSAAQPGQTPRWRNAFRMQAVQMSPSGQRVNR